MNVSTTCSMNLEASHRYQGNNHTHQRRCHWAIGDQQLITIALEMNNLLYNGYTKNVSTGDEYFKNYTTLLFKSILRTG